MRKLLGNLGRVLIGLFFAAALTFAAGQMLTARAELPCDTPEGTCTEDDDCFEACEIYNMTFNGGQCNTSRECCVCLD